MIKTSAENSPIDEGMIVQGKDIISEKWVLMPFWLVDKADTRLSPRLKLFYRELLLASLRQKSLDLTFETVVLKYLSGLEIDPMRNYLKLLVNQGMVIDWSYIRSKQVQWSISLSPEHRLHWVLAPNTNEESTMALGPYGQSLASLFQAGEQR